MRANYLHHFPETTLDKLIIVIPVVVLGSVLLILLVTGLICFTLLARRRYVEVINMKFCLGDDSACMHGYRKQRTFTINPVKHDASVAAYNPIAVSQESRRYAISSEDMFESSTIRRMSMRSSVFENRKQH